MSAKFIYKNKAYPALDPASWPEKMPQREMLKKLVSHWVEKKSVSVKTSGSTGKPKKIQHDFDRVLASARATAAFFVLPVGSVALLNLPVEKIAGRMMVYRALANEWNLIVLEPSASPLTAHGYTGCIDFAAMTPHQVTQTLKTAPSALKQVRTLIIGGAPVNPKLEKNLQGKVQQAYETYGMTETLTHIAVRRITPEPVDFFTCLPGIEVRKSNNGCLQIISDRLTSTIDTTDLVEVYTNSSFKWLGRADFTINSGGVKVQPERIEAIISDLIGRRFLITSVHDDALGQGVVLLVEGAPFSKEKEKGMMRTIKSRIHAYETPKKIIYKPQFDLTKNGKIKRPQS